MSSALVHVLEAGLVAVGLAALYNALTLPTIACLVTLVVLYVWYRRERKRAAGTIPLTGKYVLITGCDSGEEYFFMRLGFFLERYKSRTERNIILNAIRRIKYSVGVATCRKKNPYTLIFLLV